MGLANGIFYLHEWLLFYGKLVGKYAIFPWIFLGYDEWEDMEEALFFLMMIDDYDLEVTLVEVVLNFLSWVVGKKLLGGALFCKDGDSN